jgi:secondary thiamine-phosphate synthase enzyme
VEEMRILTIKTEQRVQMIDITAQVADVVRESGVKEGVCCVFVPHTTAAVTLSENTDPSVIHDFLMQLEKLIPFASPHYKHIEGNADAHIKSALVGCSVYVPVTNGRLTLGVWQGIFFCEFDGPRNRRVYVKVIG